MIRKISDLYSVSFVNDGEFMRMVIIPGEGKSQEEAEVAFAKDMRGLGDAGMVGISKADDDRIALDFGGLMEGEGEDDRSE